MNQIFGNELLVSSKSLDYLWEKQSVTSENIANVDTPGYKSKYVSFEETYRSRLKAASGNANATRNAADASVWQVNQSMRESARLDGNNVNMDAEMTELTRTALQYQYQLESVNSDIRRLTTAITG